jgi:peptidoglycan/xylan/chitin deacetylase (PgdA/CDA1 family)
MGDKYVTSDTIMNSILQSEKKLTNGLNGFILLLHIGTDPARTDKFYYHLPAVIKYLKNKGYQFARINDLLDK